ncbi:hypothetical protein A3D80_04670 [Candidatus Roizmanbacteria bacterium RIFCSPHIGHO2_02_FULL_40_13b]|uniref:Purple acid phosphatase N-terminal domain-containing protein n=1 Tax=Candidatus Roizmanbacteria bacterium RIFCSPHIGHO2_01_FULL_39_24 TaxID=1802032 RepID=A0A1F7GF01_9BACT|nr:MAG: hypothetical protein A2799_01740 [Candidatus Roizmanbacteria bacterium RIFCSPHIGHO2_01_FULL_39_24]OGK27897.1 MAG: hypothetical protein A3D80_04670 [Candidatus Roizmanbacteria bacterium RIFCSPHIGHO2_02_FULL_40_13b]OGK49821.1 MAG: hypothetical protein A3A56_02765 [Candidatus Roizmanbacteria bacterium RIFCSPLOWO2_01_FULL_40_32]
MDREKTMKFAAVGIGLIIATVVLWLGLQIVQGKFGKAATLTVQNFNCTGSGDNALAVTWEDNSSEKGVIRFRTSGTTNDLISLEDGIPENGGAGTFHHTVTLSLLSAQTTYEIRVGNDTTSGDVHECSTGGESTEIIPTTSAVKNDTLTAPTQPPGDQKLSVSEIKDRLQDGTFKDMLDCASSKQTTALSCAQAAKLLYANPSKTVSR